jgi:hypothetical protein
MSYVSPLLYKSKIINETIKIDIPITIKLYITDQVNQLKLKYTLIKLLIINS